MRNRTPAWAKAMAALALLRGIGVLAIALGKLLPRDVDEVSGKDRRTGSRLGHLSR